MDGADWAAAGARGLITALVVAALLLLARQGGRGMAGLLAGLPTVTGPALVWLALDHGTHFAVQASAGAVAAGAPCALFALGYGRLGLSHGRLAAVAAGTLLSALGLLLCPPGAWPPAVMLVAVVLCCAACRAALPRESGVRAALPPPARRPLAAAGLATVCVAGLVSLLTSLLASQVGPLWAGVLSSPPLLAAAVALELHRQGCGTSVLQFLRGYTAGLIGRSAFVALFGATLQPLGLPAALALSTTLALALGSGIATGGRPAPSIGAPPRGQP